MRPGERLRKLIVQVATAKIMDIDMNYEPEGECELAGHCALGTERHYCANAAVAEVIVNETKYLACAVCLALLAQLTTVAVYT